MQQLLQLEQRGMRHCVVAHHKIAHVQITLSEGRVLEIREPCYQSPTFDISPVENIIARVVPLHLTRWGWEILIRVFVRWAFVIGENSYYE